LKKSCYGNISAAPTALKASTGKLPLGSALRLPEPNETNRANIMLKAINTLKTMNIFSEVDRFLLLLFFLGISFSAPPGRED
jgi:hypothetical protein